MALSDSRILHIWQSFKRRPTRMVSRSQFHCEGIKTSKGEKNLYFACSLLEFDPEDHVPIRDYCTDLLNAAQDSLGHSDRLDKAFSKLVECCFITDSDGFTDEIAMQKARQLLKRLPQTTPRLYDGSTSVYLDAMDRGYFVSGSDNDFQDNNCGDTWERLQAASSWSTNIIAMALLVGQGEKSCPSPRNLRRFVDTTGELLTEATQASLRQNDPKVIEAWYIVRAFLWTSWQRATMLLFWHILRQQINSGYSYELNKELAIQGTSISSEVFTQTSIQHASQSLKSHYMCKWAYQLLRTERSSAALDFTRFHERFNALFGGRPARCCDEQSCDGKAPENCKRFKGARIKDQSAHDICCKPSRSCKRMYWDEIFYRSVKGARAVCVCSQQTMNCSSIAKHQLKHLLFHMSGAMAKAGDRRTN